MALSASPGGRRHARLLMAVFSQARNLSWGTGQTRRRVHGIASHLGPDLSDNT